MAAPAGTAAQLQTPKTTLVRYSPPAVLDKKEFLRGDLDAKKGASGAVEELLARIVPTLRFIDGNRDWTQSISSDPATRGDVINLQEQLDLRLQQRHAREVGICPIREELYAQAFDEIIRQVAVNCSERGVVLLRVRDEIRLTLASLQGLYESSVAFGMRKALMAEQRKAELKARIRILNAEVAELDRAADGLRARLAEMDAADAARAAADDAKHAAETAKLRANNEALKEALDAALGKS